MMPFFGHVLAMALKLFDRAYQNALHSSYYRSVASKSHRLFFIQIIYHSATVLQTITDNQMATLTNIYQVATISDTTGTTFISHVCMLKPSDTQMT